MDRETVYGNMPPRLFDSQEHKHTHKYITILGFEISVYHFDRGFSVEVIHS